MSIGQNTLEGAIANTFHEVLDYATRWRNLPWGIAFPEGLPPTAVPVHPTQLYEAAALVPLVILLMRWRRSGRPARFVLGVYLVLAGVIRFAIEFLRVNERGSDSFSRDRILCQNCVTCPPKPRSNTLVYGHTSTHIVVA